MNFDHVFFSIHLTVNSIEHAKITDTKKHLKSLETIVNFDRTGESHDTRAFLMKTSKHLCCIEVTLKS